ncbi:MAG TPA: hypothetical protein VF615_07465 [Longimicrobiaceae bacterium]
MKIHVTILALLCGLAAAGPAAAQHEHHAARPPAAAGAVPLYGDLGSHGYAVTTRVPAAQRYFDQGLRLYYAFNHAEAARAFGEAARLDPGCAMCHWGVALALGPNVNAPAMDSASTVQAYAAAQRALRLAPGAAPVERALVRALAVRYAPAPAADRAGLDSAYARAMAGVAREHPDDPEAATLYAESLMDLSPWAYWTAEGEPRPDTPALLASLERVVAARPDHPGACHFFIHAVEAVHPARAVPCAERLPALMSGAGHLVHMPGHIYVRVGRWMDAIRANEHAVHADEAYIRDQRPGAGIYTLGYYPHNHDFLAFAAMMAGRRAQALDAAAKVAEGIPEEALRAPGMEFLQHRMTRTLQLQVRFGRWDDVLRAPAPPGGAAPRPRHVALRARPGARRPRGRAGRGGRAGPRPRRRGRPRAGRRADGVQPAGADPAGGGGGAGREHRRGARRPRRGRRPPSRGGPARGRPGVRRAAGLDGAGAAGAGRGAARRRLPGGGGAGLPRGAGALPRQRLVAAGAGAEPPGAGEGSGGRRGGGALPRRVEGSRRRPARRPATGPLRPGPAAA